MKVLIYAVNHGREGESVLLFSHSLGTKSLQLIQKFTHTLIKTPNGIAAAGPRYGGCLIEILMVFMLTFSAPPSALSSSPMTDTSTVGDYDTSSLCLVRSNGHQTSYTVSLYKEVPGAR